MPLFSSIGFHSVSIGHSFWAHTLLSPWLRFSLRSNVARVTVIRHRSHRQQLISKVQIRQEKKWREQKKEEEFHARNEEESIWRCLCCSAIRFNSLIHTFLLMPYNFCRWLNGIVLWVKYTLLTPIIGTKIGYTIRYRTSWIVGVASLASFNCSIRHFFHSEAQFKFKHDEQTFPTHTDVQLSEIWWVSVFSDFLIVVSQWLFFIHSMPSICKNTYSWW